METPFVAPSMREAPLERNEEAFQFADRLLAGAYEMVIFLTGVGARQLIKVLSTRHSQESVIEALRKVTIVARGPKPSAALRELGVPVHVNAPEPNTWRELMQAIDGRPNAESLSRRTDARTRSSLPRSKPRAPK